MSTESRILRPFEASRHLEKALTRARFFYGSLECGVDETISIDDRSMQTPRIEWSPQDEFEGFKDDLRQGARDMGIDASGLCLVVTVRSPYLKLSHLARMYPLDGLRILPRRVDIGEDKCGTRYPEFRVGTHPTKVGAFVALSNERPQAPGLPWRKGTWLAQAGFTVRRDSDAELFRPLPLNDDERARLGLPGRAMRFVEIDSPESLTTSLDEVDAPNFWVDEQILRDLDAHATTPYATQLQSQLAIDFISSVVLEYSRQSTEESTDTYDEIKDSLIGKVARFLAGSGTAGRESMLRMCRDQPLRAVAHAEDRVRLLKTTQDSLARAAP